MSKLMEQVDELNETFNELGEDIVLLEALVFVSHMGYDFPEEYLTSGLKRMRDYIHQHLGDIKDLSRIVSKHANLTQTSETLSSPPASVTCRVPRGNQ